MKHPRIFSAAAIAGIAIAAFPGCQEEQAAQQPAKEPAPAAAVQAADPGEAPMPDARERLESRKLRGYGLAWAELSADGEEVAIHAEDAEKAALWAARYRHVNAAREIAPGVIRLPDGTFTQVRIAGATVRIRHSAEEPAPAVAEEAAPIPMYLNSWDDYCFRFYYWPGRSPREMTGKGPDWREYDPQPEFDFAKRNDNAGFVFWCDSQPNINAKGLMDNQLWDWAFRLAKDRHLPIILNTNFSFQYWLADAMPEETEQHAPQFAGSYHSVGDPNFSGAFPSWASTKARRIGLASWAGLVREYDCDEVIELLEPHGELNHGDYTVYIEHGPLADASFREYLAATYGDPAAVAARWQDSSIRSWDDCRLPEIAEFAGWGPDAIDLAGDWRGNPLPAEDGSEYPGNALDCARYVKKPVRAPAEWLQPGFDDSAWPLRYRGMPGSDINLTCWKRPAVLRRTFELPAQEGRTWLYLWDLSLAVGHRVAVHVNGKLAGESGVRHASCHWMSCEVTDLLRDGENTLALELPHGVINYRIYLTHEEPKAYPYFAPGMNAKWVDFCGWQEWSRMRSVETGIATLREVEPDKSIVAMAPSAYFDSMRSLARRYGTRFHDTGMTAACYWESLAMLMRSADLPFSVEPGGPANNRDTFRRFMNLYFQTGVNAIHYFIHVGSIFWDDGIREEFERLLPALKMMGRMRLAPPDTALVMDSRIEALMGYPWRNDPDSAFPSGYGEWRFNETLKSEFAFDAVTPEDIGAALASRYRFLVDCNNTVMTPDMASAIEAYVRAGGTYFAMFQSGRHTPDAPDSWVLRELAGVRVASMTDYRNEYHDWGASIEPDKRVKVQRAADEHWLGRDDVSLPWEFHADGAFLATEADDVEVLYRWCDGEGETPSSPAVVSRRVGEGRIVTFGVRARFYDVEARILGQMLSALGARKVPIVAQSDIHIKHFETTDGLLDAWLLANEKWNGESRPYEIRFRDGVARELTDVLTGRPAALSGTLGSQEFLLATSPRSPEEQALSAWHWVRNQFDWWQGGETPPAGLTVPEPEHPDVVEIGTGDWTFRFDDGTERTGKMETLIAGRDIPESVTSYTCERQITVPADWTDSDVELWAVGQYAHTFCPATFWVYLDGREIHYSDGGVKGRVLDLKPGDTATLRFKVENDSHPRLRGFHGNCFLFRRPHPAATFPLEGEWEAYAETTDPAPRAVTFPGRYENAMVLRREFDLPADFAGRRVRIDFRSRNDFLHAVVVNGHYLRRHHHKHGDRTILDITPWLKPGERNEIWLAGNYFNGVRNGEIEYIRLDVFHE